MLTWSWKITTAAGIGIFIHWTFALLLLWVGAQYLLAGAPVVVALESIALVLAIFACVLLHEFGHALTARRFGVATRDITLWPIGGVARLEGMPERPLHELLVALAGPAVNLAIAATLGLVLLAVEGLGGAPGGGAEILLDLGFVSSSLLAKLLYINLILAFFNLLPAFPMDGGRVLRALLAIGLDSGRATEIAAMVGQAMAIAFAVIGMFYNWILLFIALLVYFAAQQEIEQVRHRRMILGHPPDGAISPSSSSSSLRHAA